MHVHPNDLSNDDHNTQPKVEHFVSSGVWWSEVPTGTHIEPRLSQTMYVYLISSSLHCIREATSWFTDLATI